MTIAQATFGRYGLMSPTRSTAQSEPASRLAKMREDLRRHLLESYTVRSAAEGSLAELEEVRSEASVTGWNGYDAKPLDFHAYLNAKLFLAALPTTAPFPEVSADSDGEVSLDWIFGVQRALTVSIGPSGRCTFAWMRGKRTCRGTYWIDDGIPAPIADALEELVRDAATRR